MKRLQETKPMNKIFKFYNCTDDKLVAIVICDRISQAYPLLEELGYSLDELWNLPGVECGNKPAVIFGVEK